MYKKSQIWGTDLVIALLIFSVAIIVFYLYTLNVPNEGEEKVGKLFYDGKIVGGSILSEGHPKDWDSGNVIKIGILSNNKINETKLERFYNLAQANYNKTQTLFDTKYDYYFFLDENMTSIAEDVEGIGKPGTSKDNVPAENLIKITRFTIYKEKPMTAYLYIWEE